jgi:hypothetical protein
MSFDDLFLGNYKTVSERLGLTVEGGVSQGHLRIYGIVDGVPVQMWFGPHATHTSAPLTLNAAVDVHIATRTLFGKVAGLFHDGHDRIGDERFDAQFAVKSTDLPRVAAALSTDVRNSLLEAADLGLHPVVDHHAVHLRRFSNGGSDSAESIERHFHETARLARAMGGAFAVLR